MTVLSGSNQFNQLFYKGKTMEFNEAVREGTIILRKDGNSLDKRYKCNKDFMIKNPVTNYYAKRFFDEIMAVNVLLTGKEKKS